MCHRSSSMKFTKPAALVLMLTAAAAPGSLSLDAVVAANYPRMLSQIASQHHYVEMRQQAFVSATVSSKAYVVAAYSNGEVGAVELLERSASDATPVQTIRDHQVGYDPRVSAIDLDGDSQPEFVVNFALGPRGGSETWIYRLVDGRLALISPTEARGNTALGYPDIVDFGGGTMDLVGQGNIGSRDEPQIIYSHYTLGSSGVVVVGRPPAVL